MKLLQFTNFLKFNNFNSQAPLGCLNGCVVCNNFILIDLWLVFDANAIVRLFIKYGLILEKP